MDRALVTGTKGTVPPGLVSLFKDPPLVGDEKREDYDNLFSAVAAAIKPNDAIVWLLARDFTDLTWDIRREKNFKVRIIKLAQSEVICRLIIYNIGGLDLPSSREQIAEMWAANAEFRLPIENSLAKNGYDASYIMTQALKLAASQFEAIDRRIGTFEQRRRSVMRDIEQYSEASARRLAASADVIEGQFTEAAE